jgi:hypothetical protein
MFFIAFFYNICDYIDVYNKNYKYLYYEDKFGATICYIDKNQPTNKDTIFVTIIAEKYYDSEKHLGQWDVSQKNSQIAVNLEKTTNWKYYENYEEFFELFWDAIL